LASAISSCPDDESPRRCDASRVAWKIRPAADFNLLFRWDLELLARERLLDVDVSPAAVKLYWHLSSGLRAQQRRHLVNLDYRAIDVARDFVEREQARDLPRDAELSHNEVARQRGSCGTARLMGHDRAKCIIIAESVDMNFR
jgi:hypothetical protein